jgi:anti-anti-sigma regulatory factor
MDELGVSGHAMWAYEDDADRCRALVEWCQEGLRQGLRLLVGSARPVEDLRADLDGLDGRDALAREGRLTIISLDAPPPAQVILDACQRALAAGYRGLGAAGHDTAWLARAESRAAMLDLDVHADRAVEQGVPLSALCLVDARLDPRTLADFHHLHACSHSPAGEPSFRIFAEGEQLALAGEIDAFSADALARALAAAAPDEPLTIDCRRLEFVDHHALAVLEELAQRRPPLRLVGWRPAVRRLAGLLELSPAVEWA